ncbi:MAG: sugar ABC transporter permease [Trueperaceae bacterium]|nr:sugar ABC transporter permease [Trueperaceae bacterium]
MSIASSRSRAIRGRTRGGESAVWGAVFAAPQTVLFLIFFLLPVVMAFALAFMEVRPTRMTWIGLDNFRRVFNDPLFGKALVNTSIFTGVVVLFWLGKALLIAYLLDPMNRTLQTFFKSAFYLPAVTSSVIISLVWLWIFNPAFGLLNGLMVALGLQPVAWLGNTQTALPALMAMQIIMGGGSSIVLLSAALARIPRDLYEVAIIDGAKRSTIFAQIILPLIRPTLLYLVVTGTINTFQIFEAVYVMTQGGPQFATTTVVYRIYVEAFQRFNLGLASAQAIVLFAITMVLAAIQFRLMGQNVEY